MTMFSRGRRRCLHPRYEDVLYMAPWCPMSPWVPHARLGHPKIWTSALCRGASSSSTAGELRRQSLLCKNGGVLMSLMPKQIQDDMDTTAHDPWFMIMNLPPLESYEIYLIGIQPYSPEIFRQCLFRGGHSICLQLLWHAASNLPGPWRCNQFQQNQELQFECVRFLAALSQAASAHEHTCRLEEKIWWMCAIWRFQQIESGKFSQTGW